MLRAWREPAPGALATDLVLTLTAVAAREGSGGEICGVFGSGVASLSVPDRATVANMAPEYGATVGFFAPDEQVLDYLRLTGRSEQHIALVEAYLKQQRLFRSLRIAPCRVIARSCMSICVPSSRAWRGQNGRTIVSTYSVCQLSFGRRCLLPRLRAGMALPRTRWNRQYRFQWVGIPKAYGMVR